MESLDDIIVGLLLLSLLEDAVGTELGESIKTKDSKFLNVELKFVRPSTIFPALVLNELLIRLYSDSELSVIASSIVTARVRRMLKSWRFLLLHSSKDDETVTFATFEISDCNVLRTTDSKMYMSASFRHEIPFNCIV